MNLDNLAFLIYCSFFIFIIVWSLILLSNREKMWEEEAKLEAEKKA